MAKISGLSRRRGDAGVTLMELMIGLAIMTVFMTMFTGAVVMMYNSTSKAEAIGDTASQLSIAFSRLDTSVRYASDINKPLDRPSADGNWYVAWQGLASDGSRQCTQLQLDTSKDQLKQRVWPVGSGTEPSFVPLASGVHAAADWLTNSDHVPFRLVNAPGQPHQQLAIYIVAETQARTGPTMSVSDVTFTGFNTLVSAASGGDVCTDWGPST